MRGEKVQKVQYDPLQFNTKSTHEMERTTIQLIEKAKLLYENCHRPLRSRFLNINVQKVFAILKVLVVNLMFNIKDLFSSLQLSLPAISSTFFFNIVSILFHPVSKMWKDVLDIKSTRP